MTQAIPGVNIAQGMTTTQNATMVAVPSFGISGTVVDSTGVAVVGGQVSVVGTPLPPAVTDATGHYAFPSVPAGTYDITGSAPGGCYGSSTTQLTLSANATVNFTLDLHADGFGYVCRLTTADYLQANSPTGLFGDDGLVTLPLPFNFPYYNSSFASVNVTTNGFLNFQPTFPSFGNVPDSRPVRPERRGVRVLGRPDRRWQLDGQHRHVRHGAEPGVRRRMARRRAARPPEPAYELRGPARRERQHRDQLPEREPDPFQRGASASIGIEDETGTTGIQFSFGQPVLNNNMTVAYTLPPSGFVRGHDHGRQRRNARRGRDRARAAGCARSRGRSTPTRTGAYVMQLPVGAYTFEATAIELQRRKQKSVNVTSNANLQRRLRAEDRPGGRHAVDHSIDGAGQPDADAPADAREHRLGEPVVHDQRIRRRAPVHGVDGASARRTRP